MRGSWIRPSRLSRPALELLRHYRCPLTAWITGWVTAVFASSALIALFGATSGIDLAVDGISGLPAATWRIADDMSPLSKLLFGGVFGGLCWAASRLRYKRGLMRSALFAAAGIAAMLLALLLIPEDFSRGFGIGLTGARLDAAVLPCYLLGGLLAGLIYHLLASRCRLRTADNERD